MSDPPPPPSNANSFHPSPSLPTDLGSTSLPPQQITKPLTGTQDSLATLTPPGLDSIPDKVWSELSGPVNSLNAEMRNVPSSLGWTPAAIDVNGILMGNGLSVQPAPLFIPSMSDSVNVEGFVRMEGNSVDNSNSKSPRTRYMPCKQCEACKRQDCGLCPSCKDKTKFGGPNKAHQRCKLRECKSKIVKISVPKIPKTKTQAKTSKASETQPETQQTQLSQPEQQQPSQPPRPKRSTSKPLSTLLGSPASGEEDDDEDFLGESANNFAYVHRNANNKPKGKQKVQKGAARPPPERLAYRRNADYENRPSHWERSLTILKAGDIVNPLVSLPNNRLASVTEFWEMVDLWYPRLPSDWWRGVGNFESLGIKSDEFYDRFFPKPQKASSAKKFLDTSQEWAEKLELRSKRPEKIVFGESEEQWDEAFVVPANPPEPKPEISFIVHFNPNPNYKAGNVHPDTEDGIVATVRATITPDGKFTVTPNCLTPPSADEPILAGGGPKPSFDVLKIVDSKVYPKANGTANRIAELSEKLREFESTVIEPEVRRLVRKSVEEIESNSARSKDEEKRQIKQYMEYRETEARMLLEEQAKLDELMNACCQVCQDGEVMPDNQIVFCEGCNVSVHQKCYGVERVPVGDWYCRLCEPLAFKAGLTEVIAENATPGKEKPDVNGAKGIVCELCPIKTGAFVPTIEPNKFVHVCCAKWHGMGYIPPLAAEPGQPVPLVIPNSVNTNTVIESLFSYKQASRMLTKNLKCEVCNDNYGALIKCAHDRCKANLHVTCARESKGCLVIHGENCDGPVVNGWRLFCNQHSKGLRQVRLNSDIIHDKSKLGPTRFLNTPDRHLDQWIHDEKNMSIAASRTKHGAFCDLCGLRSDSEHFEHKDFVRCFTCGNFFHAECYDPNMTINKSNGMRKDHRSIICNACDFSSRNEDYETPICDMCPVVGGALKPTSRNAISKTEKKKSSRKPSGGGKRSTTPTSGSQTSQSSGSLDDEEKSVQQNDGGGSSESCPIAGASEPPKLKKKAFWCHAACGAYNDKCYYDEAPAEPWSSINITNVAMSNQRPDARTCLFIQAKQRCILCGRNDMLKVKCNQQLGGGGGRGSSCQRMMHIGCAKQAGFDVSPTGRYEGEPPERTGVTSGNVACLQHSTGEDYGLKAKIKILMAIENNRGVRGANSSNKSAAAFHAACKIICSLGWAWRWADWWVSHGFGVGGVAETSVASGGGVVRAPPVSRKKPNNSVKKSGSSRSRKKGGGGKPSSPKEVEEVKIADTLERGEPEDVVEGLPQRVIEARWCRLMAFSAALRNRDYDSDPSVLSSPNPMDSSLAVAFRAVLSCQTLCGIYDNDQIDFATLWLCRAYRSGLNSFMGIGDCKVEVDEATCKFRSDVELKKHVLGSRGLPGVRAREEDEAKEKEAKEKEAEEKEEGGGGGKAGAEGREDLAGAMKKEEGGKGGEAEDMQVDEEEEESDEDPSEPQLDDDEKWLGFENTGGDYDDFDLLNKDENVGGWMNSGNDFKASDFYYPWMASKPASGAKFRAGKSPERREGSGRKRKQTVFLNVGHEEEPQVMRNRDPKRVKQEEEEKDDGDDDEMSV
ncbi:hypothetical protein TrVE_jg7911 [Triparma verrucosa]|uniref:Uncharacterized protein n=1 Tax=Triparma verrucosa TaxID=1606542 RepID=A0A9W7F1H7_9STRA|nr:hypothetical protein TrVE_jg7911 [Triparma verrucosa]